jgi:response regulator RpfG family c-di-GMP phosphodiesterase
MLEEIVLIDDDKIVNATNRRIVEKILPTIPIKIFENGEKGLVYLISALDDNRKTLVFLDINMPIMDGFQFLNVYENAIAYQKHFFTICLLTGSIDKGDQQKAAKFPSVLEYTVKPLSEEKIRELIQHATEFLQKKETRQ